MSSFLRLLPLGGLFFACVLGCGQGAKSEDEDGSSCTPVCTGGQAGTSSGSGGTGMSQGGSATGGTAGVSAGSSPGGSSSQGGTESAGAGGSTSRGGTESGGSGDSGGAAMLTLCRQGCSVPADCAIANSASYRAENFACENGACVYTGCKGDAECNADNPGYVCRPVLGSMIQGCLKPCVTPADCSLGVPVWDADNNTCDDGACVYHGCNTDAECDATYPGRVCRPDGTGTKSCWQPCTAAAECTTTDPAFDADNYTCTDGLCRYLGCHNDAECARPPPTLFVCR